MNQTDFIISISLFVWLLAAFFYYKAKMKQHKIDKRCSSPVINRAMYSFWYWMMEPVQKLFIALNISADQITVLSVLLTLLAAYFFGSGEIIMGSWVFAFAASLDMLDGWVARVKNTVSFYGEFLDSVLDRVSDQLIAVSLLYYFRQDSYMIFVLSLFLISSTVTSYARAKCEALGFDNSGGIMQRPERVLTLCIAGALGPIFSMVLFKIVLSFLAFTSFLTAAYRIIYGYFGLKRLARQKSPAADLKIVKY